MLTVKKTLEDGGLCELGFEHFLEIRTGEVEWDKKWLGREEG